MQDPRTDQCKGKSPLEQAASQNSPLCNPPKGRRGLRSRRKGKSPLRGANWPHRKSHPGANQINYAAALGPPTLPSRPATRTPPWDPDTPRRPYKWARRSRVKQFSRRPRRDHFSELRPQPEARRSLVSELTLQLEACRGPAPELLLQPRAHRDPISEPLYQSGHQGGAISLLPDDCHSVFHHQQSLPRSARPDLILEVGLEPPAVNPASRIPREDQQVAGNPASRIPREDQQVAVETTSRIPSEDLPPVVLEIPSGSPDLEEEPPRTPESPQCPDTPGKWFRPPTQSLLRSRSSAPPSPRRSRKRSPFYGWWCE